MKSPAVNRHRMVYALVYGCGLAKRFLGPIQLRPAMYLR